MRGFLVLLVCFCVLGMSAAGCDLQKNFYKKTCPNVERVIRNLVWKKTQSDPALGAKLIRLQFHDCFVRGCDASLLLDTVGSIQAEKDARTSNSLLGFDVIDEIKAKVEELCPYTVSCADILALSARDSVSFQYKKDMWEVYTGRRDGNVSLASEVTTNNVPSAGANFTTLKQIFESKGLNAQDLVVLSGAHTIGFSHCGAFSRRLNFTGKGDTDPSLDSTYADTLRSLCPSPPNPNTTVEMDPKSSVSFDNHYYKLLTQNQGLFVSDASLLTDGPSAKLVNHLATKKNSTFFDYFAKSMKKMAAIGVLTGNDGQIRKQCRFVNP